MMTNLIGDVRLSYRLNLLASFAYIIKHHNNYIQDVSNISEVANVLIDSGGFTEYWNAIKSAATGKTITKIKVDSYIDFCHKVKYYVWGYIQLDKPRDAVNSTKLLEIQVDAGLKPIPIFIQGMEWEKLPELLAINQRVCISAGWQSAKEYSHQRYQKAYKITDGKIKSHALAWGRFPEIVGLPIASADSSTWINGSRYGVIMIFDKPKGLPIINKEKLSANFNSKRSLMILSRLMSFGVTMDDLNDIDQWRGGSYHASLTQASHTFAFLQVMRFIKLSRDIDYFIVMPGLSKSTHFSQLCAVLMAVNEYGRFDYQQYKHEINSLKALNNDEFTKYAMQSIPRYDYIR